MRCLLAVFIMMSPFLAILMLLEPVRRQIFGQRGTLVNTTHHRRGRNG